MYAVRVEPKASVVSDGSKERMGQDIMGIEEDMMSSRWNVIQFRYAIPTANVVKMDSCPSCFSKLVLTGSEN